MKTKLVVVLAAAALAMPALAQGGPGTGPGRRSGGMMRNFDPASVTTVKGKVLAVRQIEGPRGAGVHVDLETADATYDVHLGPAAFLRQQKLELKKGDELEVTGSKVELSGKPALVAQSVKKGDATVTLRDARGMPAWARRKSM